MARTGYVLLYSDGMGGGDQCNAPETLLTDAQLADLRVPRATVYPSKTSAVAQFVGTAQACFQPDAFGWLYPVSDWDGISYGDGGRLVMLGPRGGAQVLTP